MLGDDPQGPGTLQPDRTDIVRIADRQGFGPRDPCVGRPCGQRYRQDRIADPRPQRRDKGQRQHQPRKGQEDIRDPHQHHIDPAPGIARNGAHQKPRPRRDQRNQYYDVKRDPAAIDQPAQDIAAQAVGAQKVPLGPRRLQPPGQVLHKRVMRRQHRCKRRHQKQHNQDKQTRHRHRIAAKRQPSVIERGHPRLSARMGRVGHQPVPPAFSCRVAHFALGSKNL